MKKNIGVGLMGIGIVGGQVVRVLTDKVKAGVLAGYVGCPVVLRKVKIIDVDLERPIVQRVGYQVADHR